MLRASPIPAAGAKLGYNIFVTLTGCIIALVIAGVEVLSVLAIVLHWKGPFWGVMVDAPFEVLGYMIIGIFVFAFAASVLMVKCSSSSPRKQTPDRPLGML